MANMTLDAHDQRTMDNFEIGRRLRAARAERNQKDISAMAGVDDSSYGYWESGKSAIRAIDLVKVCRALNVPVTQILGLDDSEENLPRDVEVQLARLRKSIVRLYMLCPDVEPSVIDIISQMTDGWIRTLKLTEKRVKSGAALPSFAPPASAANAPPPPGYTSAGGVPVDMKEEILSRPGRKRGRPSKFR